LFQISANKGGMVTMIIGNTMNITSYLEGINKQYDARIFSSENTVSASPNSVVKKPQFSEQIPLDICNFVVGEPNIYWCEMKRLVNQLLVDRQLPVLSNKSNVCETPVFQVIHTLDVFLFCFGEGKNHGCFMALLQYEK
jgi:hypothetical protein